MSDEMDWRTIDRYLAGTSSPEEAAEAQRWLAANPAREELIARLSGTAANSEDWNVDAAWSAFAPSVGTTPGMSPSRIKQAVRWSVGIAAVAAAMIFTATRFHDRSEANSTTLAATTQLVAPNGKTTTVTLHDGTRVALNAGSTLRYPPDYGASAREVELNGEAYFDVVHDTTEPFRVRTRFGIAEDVGTRFVVRAYPELDRVEVAVADGKVALGTTMVGAGQLGILARNGSATVESGADLERWLGWTHGALVLDGMSLVEAAVVLRRHFDVDIVITTPQLAARRVRARFHDETATQAFDALTFALGAHWTQRGRIVTIAP